jgi:hypothetical protein
MKIFAQKIIAAGVGVLLLTGMPVYGDILYNNTTTDVGRSLSFINGQAIGNQMVMGSGYTSATLTNFSFEIYSTNASFSSGIQMQVFLYANDGATNANGYHMPGTALYNSGAFALPTPQSFAGGLNVGTLFFDLSLTPTNLPSNNFTLAAVVTGMSASDAVGMELFSPATVGLNYSDYWFQTVAGNNSSWALMTNSAGSTDFGAQFNGTGVPEPSTLGLSVVGASLLIGSFWLRRRQNQSRQG